MGNKRLKLPIGIQTFEKLRTEGYVYIDKTQECLYRTAMLSFLQGCGVVVASEIHTNKGRPGLVVSFKNVLWVIEIKVAYEGASAEQKAEEAYRQIIEKNYATPYPDAVRLGLGIDDALRQISASRFAN